jgi:hypothetical protein
MKENKLSREKLNQALDEIWKFYSNDKQFLDQRQGYWQEAKRLLIEFFRSDYKYFDKKAMKKEAKKLEVHLNVLRIAVHQIKSLLQPVDEEKLEKFMEKWGNDLWAEDTLGRDDAFGFIRKLLEAYDTLREQGGEE